MKLHRSRVPVVCLLASCVAAIGCDKKSTDAAPVVSASAAPAASSAAPPRLPWYVGTFESKFQVERFVMEMKKSEGMVDDWAKDDGKEASGEATLSLSIDEGKNAAGKLEGALGELTATGMLEEETLRLKLVASAPGEPAKTFNGVLVATKKADGFEGELKASSGDSLKVRSGKVVLEKTAGDDSKEQ